MSILDERFRNLVIVIFVLVVVAGVIFFFSQPGTQAGNNNQPGTTVKVGFEGFQNEFSEMQKTWVSAGIKSTTLHSAKDQLEALDDSALSGLKSQLITFAGSSTNPASQKLASLYATLVDKARADKTSAMYLSKVKGVADGCTALEDFRNLSSSMSDSFDLSAEYLEQTNSFVTAYPDEAQFLQMYKNEDYIEEAGTNKQQVQESVALLEEACR